LVIEDDPYRELSIDGTPPPVLCGRLKEAPWIYLGSFSKSFVPGLRLGFIASSPQIYEPLERLKQAADLHSNRFAQALVGADLRDPHRPIRMASLREVYRERRDTFLASLRRSFPHAEVATPRGGLFFWARLSQSLDMRLVAERALARGVAFLPGEYCFPNDKTAVGYARLNFSHPTPEHASLALAILREIVFEQEGLGRATASES
jgi:DNA-binding transcriptional MocR family regulator